MNELKWQTGPVPKTGLYWIKGVSVPKFCLAGRNPHRYVDARHNNKAVENKWAGPLEPPEEGE